MLIKKRGKKYFFYRTDNKISTAYNILLETCAENLWGRNHTVSFQITSNQLKKKYFVFRERLNLYNFIQGRIYTSLVLYNNTNKNENIFQLSRVTPLP